VDSDIETGMRDPWSKLYGSEFFERERASRLSRYELLRSVFEAVKNKYEKVEEGKLISVYKRKGS
jgi:hypothetical protein